MPFTPAHAAAAWPVRKALGRLPLSALIIGTLSPDYEYFLRLAPISRWGHTPIGLVAFCIPVSIAVWFVFRRVVRPALIDLLPPGLASALAPPSTSWAWAIVAVSVGALTHAVWDGFTHDHDWAVTAWPFLRTDVAPGLLPGLRWYKLFQHASTVGGLLAVAAWIAAWVRSQPAGARRWAPGQLARAGRAASLVVFLTAVAAFLNAMQASTWPMRLSRFAVGGMIGCAAALLLLGAGYGAARRSRRG
jgi:hypothetical protein